MSDDQQPLAVLYGQPPTLFDQRRFRGFDRHNTPPCLSLRSAVDRGGARGTRRFPCRPLAGTLSGHVPPRSRTFSPDSSSAGGRGQGHRARGRGGRGIAPGGAGAGAVRPIRGRVDPRSLPAWQPPRFPGPYHDSSSPHCAWHSSPCGCSTCSPGRGWAGGTSGCPLWCPGRWPPCCWCCPADGCHWSGAPGPRRPVRWC
ncbi:hypothetical protein CU044_0411 [Streptomyces sp. L-9-10]|nr:hypothetical protein CU044_0411 [Streptomyces sp. L-9-10]